MLEYCYIPYFNDYTRISPGDGRSCVDNAYVKSSIPIQSYKLKYDLTDHLPLFLKLDQKINEEEPQQVSKLINFKKFKKKGQKMNWREILDIEDAERATNVFIDKLQLLIKNSTYNKRKKLEPKKSWITPTLVISINKKQKLYKEHKKKPKDKKLEKKYKDYAKILKRVLKEAKSRHKKEVVEKCSNNKKKIWDFVNKKIGRKKSKIKVQNEYIFNETKTEKIKSEIGKANYFNQYFKNIAKEIYEESNPNQQRQRNYSENNNIKLNEKTFFLFLTNAEEITKIIQKLKEEG